MGFIKLLGALGIGVCLLVNSAVVQADPARHGKIVIPTTLGGRANVYPALRSWFTNALDKAAKLAANDRYPEAVDLVRKLLEQDALTRYEIAKAQQTLSTYYWTLGNYQQAYDATQAAVAANGLDNVEHLQAMFKGVQLLSMMDKFKESADDFDKYQKESPSIAGSEYLMQAINYFYQKQYPAAIQYVDKAFATGDKPASNWYQFKATSLLQSGDFAGAVAYCQELMARQPGNSQWTFMLVDAYATMQKFPEALALMNEAKSKGLVHTELQVTQFYQLYAKAGRFADAADAIDAGLAAGQLQADVRTLNAKGRFLYEAAQEVKGKPEATPLLARAIDALNKAVTLDPADGNAEFWLGQIAVFMQDDNKTARNYFVAATGKTLKHKGLAWYYLGGVEDHLDHTAAVKAALQEALQDPESKDLAERYLKGKK
jgi:tetratricopeptide (TPR) repeat protein